MIGWFKKLWFKGRMIYWSTFRMDQPVVIARDVSGSMLFQSGMPERINHTITELMGYLNAIGTHVVDFDHQVEGVRPVVYDGEKFRAPPFENLFGGGTDYECVQDYAESVNAVAIIMFSDMYGRVRPSDIPIVWMVPEEHYTEQKHMPGKKFVFDNEATAV